MNEHSAVCGGVYDLLGGQLEQVVLDLPRVAVRVVQARFFTNHKEPRQIALAAWYPHSLHAYSDAEGVAAVAYESQLLSSAVLDVFADRLVAEQTILVLHAILIVLWLYVGYEHLRNLNTSSSIFAAVLVSQLLSQSSSSSSLGISYSGIAGIIKGAGGGRSAY